MFRILRAAPIAILCCFCAFAQNAEVIVIDPAAQSHPFPHFWEQMFGSGRAVLSLRDDYRRDLRAVKAITDFQYVRFHAIFQDDVGLYNEDKEGHVSLNFSYVDQIYDGLLANGVRPFVELSFMPNQLASGPPADFFWYKLNPSPPKDLTRWGNMIDAFVHHLLTRYGATEVEQWYFEVWNEPNLPFWTGKPAEDSYYQLYDLTTRIIKQADPKLRVGGPSTAQAAWVDRFIAHCQKAGVPFDFVSTHIYGNESPKDVFGTDAPVDIRNMVPRALTKVHDQVAHSGAPSTPIIISEFNAAYLNRVDIEDSAFMGPWMANTIRACDGLTFMMSYWTFSDVFEEQGVVKSPFYGGFGLVAERNIPKAAFRAFELLHRLGDRRLDVASEDAIVTKKADGTVVAAVWNYAEPDQTGSPKTIELRLKNNKAVKYRMQIVGPGKGSSLEEWMQLGKPDSPTRDQISKLIASSQLAPATTERLENPIRLDPHSLALIEFKP
ncbi:MAG TPA: glycosyl hydrolase [Bryobacteraceae bacterium]|nr:glycosyl hydrolase [Bryobacteraceae bacterium]